MIQELVEFGKNLTEGKSLSLKEESFSKVIVINEEGEYQRFIPTKKTSILAEAITAKKGKARFLLDKCEEVLGVSVDVSRLELFKKSLEPFKDIQIFSPIFKFYDAKNPKGLRKAITAYLHSEKLGDKITFVVGDSLVLDDQETKTFISKRIEEAKTNNKKNIKKEFEDIIYNVEIVINLDGEFQVFRKLENYSISTEITKDSSNRVKEIFLVGSYEDLIGITKDEANKKHKLFLDKLKSYKELQSLYPVYKFYADEDGLGLTASIADSVFCFDKNSKNENITFMVGNTLLLKTELVKEAIINRYKEDENKLSNGRICSVCGKSDSPVLDEPYGLVKMPKGQTAGCALISFNEPAFESYGLKGNLNASLCRECARNLTEALSFMLSKGNVVPKTEKREEHYKYKHRVKISDTTVALFWTREMTNDDDCFSILDEPDEENVRNFLNSAWTGDHRLGSVMDTNMFYSCTLSSAAARIAVRDWTALSLDEYKHNLADWFHDIEIQNNSDETLVYNSLQKLINATQRDKKPNEKQKSDLNSKARIGSVLWNAAIKGRKYKIPTEVLQYVLNRIFIGNIFGSERAAIIKLIINRNTDKNMKSTLDVSNTSVAYLCGRLFAVIESMQWKAIGKVNNSIKDRFFTAAASQPAYIFGMLLTKNVPIYQHKTRGYLAKELEEIAGIISKQGSLPPRFSIIEQGEFALGYYFQRNHKSNTEKEESNN